ncbi:MULTISPECIES: hypothetical protein [unclassified Aureimonas]|uniref:hypothetical protein n=1 Tax=unclassified Aureimonas TaxID=2615206 RepID=UPI000B20E2C5|nr:MULTISPECIES: hypothetical protein [unclassified Aureimonas]
MSENDTLKRDEAIEHLRAVRAYLVEERRGAARSLATDTMLPNVMADRVVNFQRMIEAVDAAIEDEKTVTSEAKVSRVRPT